MENKQSWENRFDEKAYGDSPDFICPLNNEMCFEKIKSFISQVAQSEYERGRKEGLEEAKKLKE